MTHGFYYFDYSPFSLLFTFVLLMLLYIEWKTDNLYSRHSYSKKKIECSLGWQHYQSSLSASGCLLCLAISPSPWQLVRPGIALSEVILLTTRESLRISLIDFQVVRDPALGAVCMNNLQLWQAFHSITRGWSFMQGLGPRFRGSYK